MRGKKQNVRLWAVAFWLIVWQLAAMALHAAYPHGALLLPSPVSSLAQLWTLAGTAVFWRAIGTSSMHILAQLLHELIVLQVLAAQMQHQNGGGIGVAHQRSQQFAGLCMVMAGLAAAEGVGLDLQGGITGMKL